MFNVLVAEKAKHKINKPVRDETWDYFYSLKSKDLQDTYLQTLIEKVDVKKRTKNAVRCVQKVFLRNTWNYKICCK